MRTTKALATALAIAAFLATGCEWSFETLDGNGGPAGRTTNSVGQYPKAALIYNDRPHVFYYDETDDSLRHGYWNGSFWAFETLDGNGGPHGRTVSDVGRFTSAILYNGRPHVFYSDAGALDLRHAYYNGTAWVFETLDGHSNGPHGSILGNVGDNGAALLYNNRPHVFYRDNTNGGMRHGYWNGSFWAFEILDGVGGPNGRTTNNVGFSNAAVVYNGRPHVFYHDNTGFDLRHGYYNGTAWAFETLDGSGGPNGRINGAVGFDNATVLYNGRPHVFYYDNTNTDLRHGYWNGTAWAFETLDGSGGPNGRITGSTGHDNAAIVSGGRLRVFSLDLDGDLRHAYYTGSAWAFETLDGAGGPNGRIDGYTGGDSAVVNDGGRLRVFSRNAAVGGDNLRHGWFG